MLLTKKINNAMSSAEQTKQHQETKQQWVANNTNLKNSSSKHTCYRKNLPKTPSTFPNRDIDEFSLNNYTFHI